MADEAERARLFARTYVNLVEALLQQGVEESIARDEARRAAIMDFQLFDDEDDDTSDNPYALGKCPLCGRSG